MEKYIKADTILKFINSCLDHEDKITDTEKAVLTGVKTYIERIPAADVVEVVRCQDCVYWLGENDFCKGVCIDFSADGYCSEGKRNDGGQEEDTEGVYCTAHLYEDRALKCPYKDNVERKSKKYPCQDYRAVDGGQDGTA